MTIDVYKNVISNSLVGKLYDKWLTSDFLNQSFRDYNSFHPSDIATCHRKAYLMSIKCPGDFLIIPKQQRTFENGHSTHARYQKQLGDMRILRGWWKCYNCEMVIGKEESKGILKPLDCPQCHNPKKTPPVVDDNNNILCGPRVQFDYVELPVISLDIDMHGHSDGIIDIGGQLFIIYFKTCSNIVFKNIVDTDKPLKSHIRQVNIYMEILNVDYACILYENKNTLEIKEFYLRKDEEVVSELYDRVNECIESRVTGEIPSIPEELQEENPNDSIRFRYQNLSAYCKGFHGFPPCPFFRKCFPEIFDGMGGAEELFKYKEYNGEVKEFIKVDKVICYED